MINKVILVGRLGTDPDNISSGCKLNIATTTKHNGEERTEWHSVVCFGTLATQCLAYLKKGALVYIEGHIESREKDGKHYKNIVGEEVKFL